MRPHPHSIAGVASLGARAGHMTVWNVGDVGICIDCLCAFYLDHHGGGGAVLSDNQESVLTGHMTDWMGRRSCCCRGNCMKVGGEGGGEIVNNELNHHNCG